MRRWMLVLTLILTGFNLLLIGVRFGIHALFPSSVVSYVALRDGDPVIIIHDLNHKLKQQILYTNIASLSVSPDGKYLTFSELFRYGSDIIVSDLSGTHIRNLTQSQFRDEESVWSPDGEWIAFVSNRDGNSNIYIVRPDGSDLQNVSGNDAGYLDPTWSPDSQYLAFASNRSGNWNIYTLHLGTGECQQITNHNAPDTMPAWSPDGTHIAFVSRA